MVDGQQLMNALATFGSVFEDTADADELWRAMQWREVSAIANVLYAAGCLEVAANVLRWWIAAVELEEELTGTGEESPLDLLTRWGAHS